MLEPMKNDGKDVTLLTRPSLSKQASKNQQFSNNSK